MTALAPKVPVAVVGAGTMGAGIAQVAAAAGHRVLLFDAEQTALAHAEERIAGALARAVDQGRLAGGARPHPRPHHALRQLRCADAGWPRDRSDCRGPRREARLFQTLEVVCRSEAILASNTSSLSITALAAG